MGVAKYSDVVGKYDYVADTESDVAELPTNISPGSTCIVLETSTVYILSTDKVWTEV